MAGDTEIRKPEMPPPLLRHSYASASIVTDVLIKKYVDACRYTVRSKCGTTWKSFAALRDGKLGHDDIQYGFDLLLATTNECANQRQIVCAPILAEHWSWLDTIQSPSGKLKDAVVYAHNQKEVLCAFLSHGEMEISNNQVENAIRPFVVGRKGWLFSDTPRGAKASAIIYSLMETAKANGLNLEK